MRKVIIITICVVSMLMLTACHGLLKFISPFGFETHIEIPQKYNHIEAYHWEDNKLIIEFAEDENE